MSNSLMKALVFVGPAQDSSASHVMEMPAPIPGARSITIEVHYAGINFKDIMARRGDPGYVSAWPFVPGLEVAGLVRDVGAEVINFDVGDRVVALTNSGGLAEVVEASAILATHVPAQVDLAVAAVMPGAFTTAALLVNELGRLKPGETVLVHGAAGGVGRAVAQLARAAGASLIIGTAGSQGRTEAISAVGYDASFLRNDSLVDAIRRQTNGRGVDLVLDPQGTLLLNLDLEVTAPGGRIVLFGNASGAPLAQLPALSTLMAKNIAVAGFSLAAMSTSAPHKVTNALERVLQLVGNKSLSIELTVIDGLHAAPEAQQALAEGRGPGKQVVDVRQA